MINKIKILIAEHDRADLELIQHELQKAKINYVSETVKNQRDYTVALTSFAPDIILSDFTFPSFDGWTAFEIKQKLAPCTPFILVSGTIGEEKAVEQIRNGITDYVLKDKLLTLPVKIKRALKEAYEKRAKESTLKQLEKRERLLARAQQVARLGSWELDFSDNLIAFSDEGCRIFGLPLNENKISRETFASLVHPDDLQQILQKVKASTDALTDASYQHRIVLKDGTVKYINCESKLELDADGRPLGMYGTMQDVTEQKKAEEKQQAASHTISQLLDSHAKILNSSLDIICTIDEQGRFVTVSAAAEHILGYTSAELTGLKYIDLVVEDDAAMSIETAKRVMGGTPVTIFENRYRHKNGSIVPLLWSAKWHANDNLMYCIAKDASEKKKLEQAFESERRRFHDLFLQAPTSMGILKGPTHIFETANPLYLQLTGKKNIIGKTVSEVLPELEEQGFVKTLDEVYKTGKTFVANEMLVKLDLHGNGELEDKYLNFIYQAYTNTAGKTEGIFFFAVDVTEQVLSRKKIEESENRFRALIEKGSDLIFLENTAGNLSYISPAVTALLDYAPCELLAASLFNIIHPDDAIYYRQQTKRITETPGSSFACQQRYLAKTGGWIWCEGTVTNMFHITGINALVLNFKDISAKKMADMQQEFDRNNLHALINNTTDLMWSVDRNFNLITSNIPFDELGKAKFGFSISKGESVLAGSDTQEMLYHQKQSYERAFSGESFVQTEHFMHPVECWTQISYHPIYRGNEIVGTACHSRDITSIRNDKLQLTKSEAFNRAILNALPSNIAVVDNAGKLLMVNEMWDRFSIENGETTLESTGKGSNYFEVCKKAAETGDEIAAWALQGLQEVMLGKTDTFYLEYPCHTPTAKCWYGMRINKFETDEKMVVIAHQEITERKLAEEKIKESENKYRTLIEQASDGILLIDKEGALLEVNTSAATLFGYSKNELIKMNIKELVFATDVPPRINQVIDGETLIYERAMKRKNGTAVEVEISASMIQGNCVFAMVRDNTERKKASEEMKKLNTRLLLATKSAGMGVWEWDLETGSINWDDGMYQLYKIDEKQFGSVYEGWISRLHPQDTDRVNEEVQMALNGTKEYDTEFRVIWNDQSVRHIRATGITETNTEGKIIRLTGVNWDITDRVIAKKKLEEQNKELRKTNEELDRFVYSTSHDLRAPLKSLLGLTDMVLEDTDPANQPQIEQLHMMKTSVLKLDNFIEDILNYSRNARQEITCETINAEELIREIWVSHKFTEGVKNIALKIDVIKQHSFNSDKRRVLIIINNLISNAIKYRDAAKQKSFVHITIDISNGVANITIADNGIGIFKNKQEKIFDMFYRATTVSTGTGIGLYIVKQTLEKLEGSVQVESEPGTGTTISISIPDKTFNYNRLQ